MSSLLTPAFALALAFAGFFFEAGRREADQGFIWGAASLTLSLLLLVTFHVGAVAIGVAQLFVFVGIAAFRVWREDK